MQLFCEFVWWSLKGVKEGLKTALPRVKMMVFLPLIPHKTPKLDSSSDLLSTPTRMTHPLPSYIDILKTFTIRGSWHSRLLFFMHLIFQNCRRPHFSCWTYYRLLVHFESNQQNNGLKLRMWRKMSRRTQMRGYWGNKESYSAKVYGWWSKSATYRSAILWKTKARSWSS